MDVVELAAELLAVVVLRAAGRSVADCELSVPRSLLPTEFHALVGSGHVDARDRADERSLVLEAQSVRQVQLAGLDVPAMVRRPVQHVRLAVQRTPWCQELVDIYGEAIRNDRGVDVQSGLLQIELVRAGGVGDLRVASVEAQITAYGEEARDVAGPCVRAGVQVLRGELRLSEHVAEGIPHSAARRVDVTLLAFEAGLHGQIRLGMRAQREQTGCQQQERGEREAQLGSCRSVGSDHFAAHCAGLTVNSNEKSVPSGCPLMSATAPPPVPRTVTRYMPGGSALVGWITTEDGLACAGDIEKAIGLADPDALSSSASRAIVV